MIKTYLKRTFQAGSELRHDHTQLFPSRNIGLTPPHIHRPSFHELGDLLPVDFVPCLIIHPVQTRRRVSQVLGDFVSFFFAHGFPVEIQTVNESTSFSRVVLLEAEAEEHGLGAYKSSAEVLRGGERQAEDKV